MKTPTKKSSSLAMVESTPIQTRSGRKRKMAPQTVMIPRTRQEHACIQPSQTTPRRRGSRQSSGREFDGIASSSKKRLLPLIASSGDENRENISNGNCLTTQLQVPLAKDGDKATIDSTMVKMQQPTLNSSERTTEAPIRSKRPSPSNCMLVATAPSEEESYTKGNVSRIVVNGTTNHSKIAHSEPPVSATSDLNEIRQDEVATVVNGGVAVDCEVASVTDESDVFDSQPTQDTLGLESQNHIETPPNLTQGTNENVLEELTHCNPDVGHKNIAEIECSTKDGSNLNAPASPHNVEITPDMINAMAECLFTAEYIVDRPCISARLFACFAVHEEKLYGMPSFTKRGENRIEGDMTQPLLPFLQSLVNVEAISLRPFNNQTDTSSEHATANESTTIPLIIAENSLEAKPLDSPRRPRIQFSGIDCSSTLPPVDRVNGSESHQRESINAMIAAKECIDELEQHSRNDLEVLERLDRIISFFGTSLMGEDNNLQQACAKAICSDFLSSRIESARKVYLGDLELLRTRLMKCDHNLMDAETCENIVHSENLTSKQSLTVETRLAGFVGQTIRYYLRMFLNPQPPRLTPKDTLYCQRSDSFSKVSMLVQLSMPVNGQSNEALDDACISALVSTALQRVYEFCGPDALLMSKERVEYQKKHVDLIITLLPDIPTSFCTRPASQMYVSTRPPFTYFDEDDLSEIQDDIQEATAFLSAAKASRFLVDLFTSKGVQAEIDRLGGWGKVEKYAEISRRYKLWQICDFDAHLVPLCNHQAFINRLTEICSILEKQVQSCEASLSSLSKRLRLTTKSKNIATNYPTISVIMDAYQDSSEMVSAFPVVGKKRSQKRKK